ncbi:MAG: AMIN domain-containing protein, partial [Acidobacteria bacterium]|nr:AMIN domain-containing protein [Acidobacteriota bacterium]
MLRHTTTILCVVVALGVTVPMAASGARANAVTLKKIASRVDSRMGVIAIEASDPVPYVASQPDPRLFVIELRDVVALGFDDDFEPDARHPFAAMQVESGRAPDGVTVARVSLLLSQPLRPRVRSSRNVIYVEADRLDRGPTTAGAIAPAGPASAIRDVRVTRRGTATAVTLRATGRLTAAGIAEAKEGPPRLVLDLPNATSALPGTTPIGQDPVDKVTIGLHPTSPLLTRVVMDLTRRAPFRLESSPDGLDLTVVFDEPPSAAPLASASQGPASLVPPVAQQVLAQAQPPPAPAAQQPPAGQQPPAAPTPIAAVAQQPAATTGPRPCTFDRTGFPVSLDFQGADLRAVLRTLAEISGLNVVIDPAIQGTV